MIMNAAVSCLYLKQIQVGMVGSGWCVWGVGLTQGPVDFRLVVFIRIWFVGLL